MDEICPKNIKTKVVFTKIETDDKENLIAFNLLSLNIQHSYSSRFPIV